MCAALQQPSTQQRLEEACSSRLYRYRKRHAYHSTAAPDPKVEATLSRLQSSLPGISVSRALYFVACVGMHDPLKHRPIFCLSGMATHTACDGWTKSGRYFVGLSFAPTVNLGEHSLRWDRALTAC